jgi:hypothetical protein
MQLINKGPLLIETYKTTRLLPQYVKGTGQTGFAFSISFLRIGLIVIFWGF